MLRTYVVFAWRAFMKNKFYGLLNIVGLALSIAACLMIALFVIGERQFDEHHEKRARIYRLDSELKFGNIHVFLAVAPAPMGQRLMQDYPEIESTVRFRTRGSYLIRRERNMMNFKESNVAWTDSTFFSVFTVPLIDGDATTALRDPNSVAISETIAVKYFPEGGAIGKTLILDNSRKHTVTSVFEDMPATGHFRFDVLLPLSGRDEAQSQDMMATNFQTYFLLRPGTDPEALRAKFPEFVDRYILPKAVSLVGTKEDFVAAGNKLEYTLTPLPAIHLQSNKVGEFASNGNIVYNYVFSVIGLFIFMIAIINFMNMSVAQSASRAKEVGVRKVLGSMRSHIVNQLLAESTFVCILSLALAVLVAWIVLPSFNELAQRNLSLPLDSPLFYIAIAGTPLFSGAIAGAYPSFLLSSLKPVHALKGNFLPGKGSNGLRSCLVVFQFTISALLLIATATVGRQLRFMQTRDVGFNKDHVIIVHDAYALKGNAEAFRNEVLKNSFVKSGTLSGFLPIDGTSRDNDPFYRYGDIPTDGNPVVLQTWYVDHDYVTTLGMKIREGRSFSTEYLSDSLAVILNAAAISELGLTAPVIGSKIVTYRKELPGGGFDLASAVEYTVIGVLEDFHIESMKKEISPLGLFLGKNNGYASFRFEGGHAEEAVSAVEKCWKAIAGDQPFLFTFLDDDFRRIYESEARLKNIFSLFAGLAIIIGCVGLFSLTAFTTQQRTKEIGIRKVLGASVASVVILLSRSIGIRIMIAFILATPLGWLAADWWLSNYTYKADIGPELFVTVGAALFGIGWLTGSYLSIHAALKNPVRTLRNE